MSFFPAPSAPPTYVSTTEVTSFSITVIWGPVDCIHSNGDVTGYSVHYGVQGSGKTENVSISGSAVTETTISGLDFSTNYSIQVAAVNNVGIGIYSDPIIFTTESKGLHNLDPIDYTIKDVKHNHYHQEVILYPINLIAMLKSTVFACQNTPCQNPYFSLLSLFFNLTNLIANIRSADSLQMYDRI